MADLYSHFPSALTVFGSLSPAHWILQVELSLQARLHVPVQIRVQVAPDEHSRLAEFPTVIAQVAALHLGLALAPRVKVHRVAESEQMGSQDELQVPVQELPFEHVIFPLLGASQPQVLPAGHAQTVPVQGQSAPGHWTVAGVSLPQPESARRTTTRAGRRDMHAPEQVAGLSD